jgi:hypothetical protein
MSDRNLPGNAWLSWSGAIAISALSLAAVPAYADDYCCICRGKTEGKTISAGDELSAGAQCSITCRRPTRARPGKCEAATPPAAPPAAAAPAGSAMLFASDDCSGTGSKATASTAKLAGGIRSFMVDAGAPASVWQNADYNGSRTQPVGPGICISPGWEIGSLRFEGK